MSESRRPRGRPFVKGQSGNPKGRPRKFGGAEDPAERARERSRRKYQLDRLHDPDGHRQRIRAKLKALEDRMSPEKRRTLKHAEKRRYRLRYPAKVREKAWLRYITKKFGQLNPDVIEMLRIVREWRAQFGGAGRPRREQRC